MGQGTCLTQAMCRVRLRRVRNVAVGSSTKGAVGNLGTLSAISIAMQVVGPLAFQEIDRCIGW